MKSCEDCGQSQESVRVKDDPEHPPSPGDCCLVTRIKEEVDNAGHSECVDEPEHVKQAAWCVESVVQVPSCSAAAGARGVSAAAALAGLYTDHTVKGELVLGPEVLHRPNVTSAFSGDCCLATPIKEEADNAWHSECVDETEHVKQAAWCVESVVQAPSCSAAAGARGVSAAAALAGLYTDHTVKGELVLGPEVLHRPNVTSAFSGTMPADRDSRQEPHLALKDCTVRLERIPYNTLLARTERTSEVEDIDQCEVNAPPPATRAARAAPACPARRERCDAVPTDTRQETNKGIQHTYVCDTCGKAFDEKVVLVRHIRAHAQEKYKFDTSKGSKTSKLYSCDICNEQFPKKHNLIEHRYIHRGKKAYSCDICRKQFTRKDSLATHLLIHTGQKPYSCEICKRRFSQKCSLMRHKAFIHRDMSLEDKWRMKTMKVMCTICNKPFLDLKTHIVIHTGEKPHSCDICQKQFTRKSTMEDHQRIHTGERPYSCTVCAKIFRQISALYRHKRLHAGKKPYNCEICKMKFGRSDHLSDHKRTHLNPRKKKGRSRKTNLDQVNDDDVLPYASADGNVLTKSVRKSISVSYDTGPTEG